MTRVFNIVSFCAFIAVPTTAFGRGADTPKGILTAYDQSVKASGPKDFMNVCDNEIGTFGPGNTCGALLKRAWQEKIKLSAGPEEIKGPRATLDVAVEKDGKKIETLYFLLADFKGKWLLKAISADQGSKAPHLAGK